jgi:RHS repeat-associated protein
MKHKYQIIAGALAVSIIATAYVGAASLSAPLPEFRTNEQLTAQRSPVGESQRSSGVNVSSNSEEFYTGKVIDVDSGAYTFWFRNYDPSLSRWLSGDPSGFPDGANSHIYAGAPTSGLDPSGLAWMFVGSNSSAGSYSDSFSAPVDIDGSYNGSVSISGFASGKASSLTIGVTAGTSVDGWIQSAQSSLSKQFTLNINGTSGEVTMSGVTQFTKSGSAWSLGNVSTAYNAGIQDGENVVQGHVAFGHGYSGWGDVSLGYEGGGLTVGVTIANVSWSLPTGISFSANKQYFE